MNYYFLNTGNQNFSNGANWSDTDNGTPVNTIPTNADDVFFTINSSNCTVDITATVMNVTFTGYNKTMTLNAAFTVQNLLQVTSGDITWAGNFGFVTKDFISLGNTGGTTTLKAGLTYTIRERYIRTSERGILHGKVVSSVPGSKAILKVSGDINIGYVNFTDIDASQGRTLYPFNGVVTRCINIISMTDMIYPPNRTNAKSFII